MITLKELFCTVMSVCHAKKRDSFKLVSHSQISIVYSLKHVLESSFHNSVFLITSSVDCSVTVYHCKGILRELALLVLKSNSGILL